MGTEGAVRRYNIQNLRPGAGLVEMQRWRRTHPDRFREIMQESHQHAYRTSAKYRANLARACARAREVNRREIDWPEIARLRGQGLSWRRIREVTGIPVTTLLTRRRADRVDVP